VYLLKGISLSKEEKEIYSFTSELKVAVFCDRINVVISGCG
jgi:hypothetical protein